MIPAPSASVIPAPAVAPPSRAGTPLTPPIRDALLVALSRIDLTSADGRAGLGALLSEIERLSPGAILRQAAGMELRRAGARGGA